MSTGRNDFWQTDAYFIMFLILILSFPCHFAEIMEAVAALCSTLKILKWQDVAGCDRMWQDVAGCGRMWQDVAGCGRHGEAEVAIQRSQNIFK